MKLWEVMKELEENPWKRFELSLIDGFKGYMYTKDAYYRLDIHDHNGLLISQQRDGGAFNDNVYISKEWQEVKQQVSWQEAFEAWLDGKTVFCFLENGKRVEYDQNINFIHAHSLKTGTWYIED